MKIASIYFDDIIVVPQGQQLGPTQPYTTLREQSFHAHEGWDIRETLPGVFSLLHEGMSGPVTVGGYGYTYTREPEPVAEEIVEDIAMMQAMAIVGTNAAQARRGRKR